MDLLSPSAPDRISTRAGEALLHHPPIPARNVRTLPIRDEVTMIEENRAITVTLNRPQVVCYQHDRLPFALVAPEHLEALLLEPSVAHSEDFIHEQDLSVRLDGDREREADLHPGREILQLLVHEVTQICEVDYGVEAVPKLLSRSTPVLLR